MAEVKFYEAAQRGLGEKFSSSVEKAVSLIVAFPDVGSPFCFQHTARCRQRLSILACLQVFSE